MRRAAALVVLPPLSPPGQADCPGAGRQRRGRGCAPGGARRCMGGELGRWAGRQARRAQAGRQGAHLRPCVCACAVCTKLRELTLKGRRFEDMVRATTGVGRGGGAGRIVLPGQQQQQHCTHPSPPPRPPARPPTAGGGGWHGRGHVHPGRHLDPKRRVAGGGEGGGQAGRRNTPACPAWSKPRCSPPPPHPTRRPHQPHAPLPQSAGQRGAASRGPVPVSAEGAQDRGLQSYQGERAVTLGGRAGLWACPAR